MKCGNCGTEKGLIMKMELYKDGVKFDAGIIDTDTIIICRDCILKMILNMEYNDTNIEGIDYGGGELDEFMANFLGETLYP